MDLTVDCLCKARAREKEEREGERERETENGKTERISRRSIECSVETDFYLNDTVVGSADPPIQANGFVQI